ncbi:MAG: RNA polymerase subunit sigma-24 [Myxococcales bacterium]|nr:RNA polymerase subunit sigma-24 [Myxococcales bacterium]|tara:strand:+ start:1535 stop:2353 length:819 start_codon:yes stop_codon:yes gene_type:complete
MAQDVFWWGSLARQTAINRGLNLNLTDEITPEENGDQTREALEKLAAASERAQTEQEKRQAARAAELPLVEAAQAGDAQAFEKLLTKSQQKLFSLALGMLHDRDDAKDAVQETWIKAYKKLQDFQANASFGTWLYRICVNVCIDKQRAAKRRKKVDIDNIAPLSTDDDNLYAQVDVAPDTTGSNPLKNIANKELGDKIQDGLRGLTEDHRSVLLLREVEGMSYDEISEALEIPKGTVMSRLYHARRNLQHLLAPYLESDEGDPSDFNEDLVE